MGVPMTNLLRHRSPEVSHDETSAQVPSDQVVQRPALENSVRGAPLSLILGGFLALLLSAWAGIVPFIGPTFGFSPDATGSLTWNQVHAFGAVVPEAVGVLACLLIIANARRPTGFPAPGVLGTSGFLVFLCGAWLAVVPAVCPVMAGSYFQAASPSRTLAYWLGLALGPGVLLTAFGGFTMGRAEREKYSSQVHSVNGRTTIDVRVPPGTSQWRRTPEMRERGCHATI